MLRWSKCCWHRSASRVRCIHAGGATIPKVKTCARCGAQRPYNCIVCHTDLCGECSENACAVDQVEVDEINQRSRQTDGEGRRRIANELSPLRKRLQ